MIASARTSASMLALSAALIAGHAFAQAAPSSAPSGPPAGTSPPATATDGSTDQKDARKPEETEKPENDIVVTGERANRIGTDTVQSGSFRNAKILDVPMTVSVLPSALLQSQQAISLIDAVRNTAGVGTSGVGPVAYNNITIRGITVDTRSSYKMDGALNMISSTAFPLEDKDRIEVLKGASALYYGFSPPSGIVNFVMKRPTPQFSLYENSYGDGYGTLGEHVDIGDTIGIFGFRVNGVIQHTDVGIQYATGHRNVVSGTFDLKPTSRLTLTADIENFENAITEPGLFLIPQGVTTIPNIKLLDPQTNIAGADWTENYTHETNLLGKAAYKFSKDWNLTGYYGRSKLYRFRYNPQFQPTNSTTSFDPSSPQYGAGRIRFAAQDTGYTNYSYGGDLAGTIHVGTIRNEVLAGASRSIRTLAASANVFTLRNQNFANPVYIPNLNLVAPARPTPSRIDDKGVYVFDRLSFHDIVQLLGGVRRSSFSDTGSVSVSNKTPYSVKVTSWSGGAVIKPVRWASAYGTYIEGLEGNPVATVNAENAYQAFAPISSKLYEGGLKLEPRSNLLIQLSYFDIKRNGVENERTNPATGKLRGYGDANQEFKGPEASISGYVIPDLAVNATYTLLSARYKNFPVTAAGNRVEGTPRNTWSLFGEYTPSWLTPDFKFTAGAFHTGSQELDQTNRALINPYTTFDLGGSYTWKIEQQHALTLRINAQNFTGRRYWGTVSNGTLAPGLPSVVKFSLAYKY